MCGPSRRSTLLTKAIGSRYEPEFDESYFCYTLLRLYVITSLRAAFTFGLTIGSSFVF